MKKTPSARKVLGWPKRCMLARAAVHCCADAARMGCDWPNSWANDCGILLTFFSKSRSRRGHPVLRDPLHRRRLRPAVRHCGRAGRRSEPAVRLARGREIMAGYLSGFGCFRAVMFQNTIHDYIELFRTVSEIVLEYPKPDSADRQPCA